ncbi:MAG: metal ABC transporter ATP-binding protein [Clostridia bacterium]|nr:metal ABC transporter ATP-binding protein [Clostridia bacterium]
MALLTVQDLTLGYEGRTLVSHLNFSLEEGDYLCIVGENGSGKSTLMRTILGLQPPVSGQVLFREGLKSSHVGYLPQQTPIQRDFPASVEEIVRSGFQGRCGLRPFYDREEKAMARENMERMGVLDLRDRCYRELSGGQQQRVLLARALCAARKVLLLDEPVSGLDPKATGEMYDLLEGLNREGLALIMISHDIGAALTYASHILHLGQQVFFGTREAYQNSAVGRRFVEREGDSL